MSPQSTPSRSRSTSPVRFLSPPARPLSISSSNSTSTSRSTSPMRTLLSSPSTSRAASTTPAGGPSKPPPVRASSTSPSRLASVSPVRPSSRSLSLPHSRSTSPVRASLSPSPSPLSTSPVHPSSRSLSLPHSRSTSPVRASLSPSPSPLSTSPVRASSLSLPRSRSTSPVRASLSPRSRSPSPVRASSRSLQRSTSPVRASSCSLSRSDSTLSTSSGAPSHSPQPPISRVPSPPLSTGPSSNDSQTPIPQTPPTANSTQSADPRKRSGRKLSAAEQEWQRQKDEEDAENDAIDELMELVGLEEVKDQILAIKAKVEIYQRQNINPGKERFNIVFQGNPGTGKTTVARIYANFLESSGVLKSSEVVETSGAKLAYQGPSAVESMIKALIGIGGGVLFVDEAYQLTAPHVGDGGRQVLDIILTEMENHIGELVVIFAGYNKEMQSFFEHNPGLASRVPYTLEFADFEDTQLLDILRDSIDKRYNGKLTINGGMDGLYMRIAIRRLARSRGVRGFGNARSVHNLLAKISERQAKRLTKERRANPNQNYFEFTKEDVIGPDPSKAIPESKAWAKLQALTGLEEVKTAARSMTDMIVTNYRRELQERKPLDFSLNRVFFGSPGTGKTTVAKLYGQILADLGLLSNGEVVIKNPSDFIGQCLGKSEARTRAILATTIGKVLIIDEAYMLNTGGTGNQQDTYKTAVIDTLVAEVQGVPGDDRCILILGYEDKLKEMFHNVNPGLSRRFAIEDPFRFQDFDLPQLGQILGLKMEAQDLSATPQALSVALEVMDRARMRPNFSNGGEVDNLLAKTKLNYQTRQSKKPVLDRAFDAVFEPEDFDPDFNRNVNAIANCRKLLEGRVGDDIIRTLEGYQKCAISAKARKVDPREEVPTNFVFKGAPGTGKTVTARNMGKVYYDMGFLSTDEVVECSASDLIGQFVGHTGPKTKAQLDKALGKVLFVDEAYRLTEGQYATEAVNELIYLLTTPKYAGKMIVILAGYTQDMNDLMKARPALSGLFPEEIIFQNMKPQDCLTLLHRELKQKRIKASFLESTSTAGYRNLLRLVKMLTVFPSWSNARDIKTLAKAMSMSVLGETTLSADQAVDCTKKMITVQYGRCSGQEGRNIKLPHMAVEKDQAASQPLQCAQGPNIAHDQTSCCDTDIKSSDVPVQITPQNAGNTAGVLDQTTAPPQSPPLASCLRPRNASTTREEGVSDTAWDQLQADKEAEKRVNEATEAALNHLRQEIIDLKVNWGAQIDHATAARLQQEWEAKEKELEKMQHEYDEKQKKEQAVQEKLRKMGVCVYGYQWVRAEGGYRCEGGSHFVADGQL